MPISCLVWSRHLLVYSTSWRLRMRHSPRHRLNARTAINWKRNFKENINKKILRRKNKERSCNVIMWIESCCFFVHWGMKCRLNSVFIHIRCNFLDISCLSETQKNSFLFLNEWIPLSHAHIRAIKCLFTDVCVSWTRIAVTLSVEIWRSDYIPKPLLCLI